MNSITGVAGSVSVAHCSTTNARLMRAAQEFEGQMMKELMRPLNRQSASCLSDSNDDGDSSPEGALGDFASDALAQALSVRGGFGIASRIVRELSSTGNQNETVPVTGRPLVDTRVNFLKGLQ